MKKAGIVLCSRTDSSRVPNKPLKKVNGKTVIEHLIYRLIQSTVHVYLAVPLDQVKDYEFLKDIFSAEDVTIVGGVAEDPLARMYHVATTFRLDPVIRVSHDKIFVDDATLLKCLGMFHRHDLDYGYSNQFTEGSGFEIISYEILQRAFEQFKNVEHISYAVRSVTEYTHNFEINECLQSDYRLLIDYPEDMALMKTLIKHLGNNCTLLEVLDFMDKNLWAEKINKLPKVSIYTCAYNAQKHIEKCMGSVSKQNSFKDFEYIIVDDASEDDTLKLCSKFSTIYSNVKVVSNDSNIGLASSSNVAIENCRGKYVVRLDADDYFPSNTALVDLLNAIENSGDKDVIYPNNFFGSYKKIQKGRVAHHVGGAIFSRRALNHIKFTDDLRNYDGLDLFLRARAQLRIGYLNKPIFFYRQSLTSMSKTNLEDRKKIKDMLNAKV